MTFLNCIVIPYVSVAIVLLLFTLRVFLADKMTPKTHLNSWGFLIEISVLWPLTLPFILRKRLFLASKDATDLTQNPPFNQPV
ncbi:MAG: hypothetical protein AAF215_19240 [Cyanobacteria bacterium P01_A01_bin.123]